MALAIAAVGGGETMIFDEIDAGIGGTTAHAVAETLRRLAERAQVITITHLPQIATVADRHFRVEKVPGDPTVTRIEALDDAQRRDEVERMLGGAEFLASLERMSLADFERVPLTFGPSPVHRLERLSAHLGGEVEIWAKREDCNSGLAYGGNKVRKLEYLAADALAQGCDTLVSIGGVQSNHTRQVAAVAAHLGLGCVLVQEHWVEWPDVVYDKVGNILLSRLHGRRRAARSGRLRHRDPAELAGGAGVGARAWRQAVSDPGRSVRPSARRPRLRALGRRGGRAGARARHASSTRSSSARSPGRRRPG